MSSSHGFPQLLVPFLLIPALVGCRGPDPEPPAPAKVPVVSEVLGTGTFQPTVDLLGRVEPAERLEIRPRFPGNIRYAPRFAGGLPTGARVTSGEPLFTVDNPELALREAEARLVLRGAEAELDRAKRGVDGGFLSVAELRTREIEAELARERLESAERDAHQLAVKAPSAGILRVQRAVPGGTQVSPGDLVAELARDGDLRVEAWATSADLDRLGVGMQVECLAPGSKRVLGLGKVEQVAAEVDDAGVARLVASVDRDQGMPRSGEGVELRIRLPETEDAITVPERALVINGSIVSVFVLESEGLAYQATSRAVVLGRRDGERVEIRDGLEAGERIAVLGSEYLAEGLLASEATETPSGGEGP
ncbi:MAG: efflux RND transporter periplasmic adaptor subunit [Acidobacteriota bacterium]